MSQLLEQILSRDNMLRAYKSVKANKGAAVLTLGQLSPGVAEATEEQLAQAIASTFCDNMELDSVTVKAGDKTYGPLKYKE